MPLGNPGTMATEQFDSGIAGESGATQGQGGVSGQIAPFNLAGGLINQGATATGPMESTGGQGAITAGTGTTEGGVYQDKILRDVTRPPEEVEQLETGTPEYHTAQKEFLDKSIMQASEGLDKKAKEMRAKHGLFSKEYQQAQRLANAFKSLDQYSKAYSGTQAEVLWVAFFLERCH